MTGRARTPPPCDWPVAVQVLFFLVTQDFYIYWFHRWQHNNKFLWRLHEAHHSTREVDWLAGTRSHCFEILINQTVEFAPMILVGASPEVPLIKGMISAVWGMCIHSNIDVRGGRLQLLINGPEAHRWHHLVDLAPPGMNFGTKLAIWDLLFGTAYLPGGATQRLRPHLRRVLQGLLAPEPLRLQALPAPRLDAPLAGAVTAFGRRPIGALRLTNPVASLGALPRPLQLARGQPGARSRVEA